MPAKASRSPRTPGWRNRDVLRTAGLVIAIYLLLQLLWAVSTLVIAVFLGVLFGVALAGGVDKLEERRIPRVIGAAGIVIAFFGLLTAFGAWMAPTIRDQGRELREKLPQAVDRIENWLQAREGGIIGMVVGAARESADSARAGSEGDSVAASSAADTAGGAGGAPRIAEAPAGSTPGAAPPADVAARSAPPAQEEASEDTTETGPPTVTDRLRDRLGGQLSGVSRYLFPFISHTIAVVAGFLLIVFLAIYIAVDPEMYRRGLMMLVPRPSRERAGEVFSAIAVTLRRWLLAELVAMVVIGTITTVALLILDVEAAFALGLLAGLLEFIPTVGPILSAIPAIGMGFLDSPEKALTVAAVYIGIQFLENQLLIPILMKGGVDLPPALTLVAQALLALLFGFLGLMVAVPALAATMVAVKMLYVQDVVGEQVRVLGHDNGNGDDDGDEDEPG
jgi:predicted PurR-regulated permease PerM